MQTKNTWSIVALVGMLVVLFAACESTEEELDGGMDAGILDGAVQPDTGVDSGPPPPPAYRFVKIEDLSEIVGAGDGADIDAVELDKDGTSSWVSEVVSCTLPDGEPCINSEAVVGESDAFCGDPIDYGRCFSNFGTEDPAPYVALGGTVEEVAGAVVVQMDAAIEEGDSLIVYELGNCEVSARCEDTTTVNAAADSIKVSVGTSAEGPWVEVLAASTAEEHPTITIVVPALP